MAYIVPILDKDPTVSVQYIMDSDLREGCFELGLVVVALMKHLALRKLSDHDIKSQLYSNYFSNVNYVHSSADFNDLMVMYDMWGHFLNEYKFRFEKEHPSFQQYSFLKDHILKLKFTLPKNYDWGIQNYLPDEFVLDDNHKKWSRIVRTLQNPHPPAKTISVKNSFRAWYKDRWRKTKPLLAVYTKRTTPDFL